MGVIALADFGSTYTKLALVDREEGRLLARAQAPTSADTDVMHGYAEALAAAREGIGGEFEIEREIAASSAGGGLRVAAVGLVDDLTAAAARQAALNAGARVGEVLFGSIRDEDRERLHRYRPDIVLYAGGTDGGQRELVLENARRLANHGLEARVVVACNAAIAEPVAEIFAAAGIHAVATDNVMPALGRLEVEGAREAISTLFLEHVIGGKHLSADPAFEQMVRCPTPQAVLAATRLLAGEGDDGGTERDVVLVDVGGATTDVHSVRAPEPQTPGVRTSLLPPPAVLRTVEGDLGLRSGAAGVLDADRSWLGEGFSRDGLEEGVRVRTERPAWIPEAPSDVELDGLLAVACVTQALARHCGRMMLTRGRLGGTPTFVREGPDLRASRTLIGTGGVLSRRPDGEETLRRALARRAQHSLSPEAPEVIVDRDYMTAAAGLLASFDREAGRRLLRRQLRDNLKC